MKISIEPKVFAAVFLVFSLFSCGPQNQEQKVEEESFGATPVKVFKVRKQRISEKLHYTGIIEPWNKINITPDIAGKVAKIYVEEGQKVRKGQLLAELDTRTTRLQLEQAQAALAVAEANHKDAQRNMERMERLQQEKAVSDQQYEKIRLAYEAAEAQLQQARASLNLARHNLEVSLMRAPFDGVVASKNADVGDVINPMMGGFSPTSGVLTLMDFYGVKIEVDVSHKDIVRIQKGQPALLQVDVFPDKVFRGQVSVVNQTADPLTKKFKVVVRVDNPNLRLRPNTFGEVTLEVSTHEQALVMPQRAVVEDQFVFVAQQNKALRRKVTLGLQNAEMVEVVDGVAEGDMVIVKGNYGLVDGAEVSIEEGTQ